ncbi:MAG: AAA family ATPase [Sphingomonadaceae bacterium]
MTQEEFYGLSSRPFDSQADAAEYFPGLTFRKAVTTIGHGLNKGGGIVVVTGAKGAGKTSLLFHLSDKLEAEAVTLALLSAGHAEASDVLPSVVLAFGLDDAEIRTESPLAALDQFFQDEARRGSRVLLLVDDAQAAGEEGLIALQELGRLRLGDRPLVQMVLAGEPALASQIAETPGLDDLRDRLTVEYTLDGLMADEIGPYMESRLKEAGWEGQPALDPSIPALLHEATDGDPGLINQAMSRLLELGAERKSMILSTELLEDVLRDSPEIEFAHHTSLTIEGVTGEDMERDAEDQVVEECSMPLDEPSNHSAEALQAPTAVRSESGLVEAQIVAIEEAFSHRDKTFNKLRREVDELREYSSGQSVSDRIDAIERRLEEQERILRHMLTRLIDVFEQRDQQPDKS